MHVMVYIFGGRGQKVTGFIEYNILTISLVPKVTQFIFSRFIAFLVK